MSCQLHAHYMSMSLNASIIKWTDAEHSVHTTFEDRRALQGNDIWQSIELKNIDNINNLFQMYFRFSINLNKFKG